MRIFTAVCCSNAKDNLKMKTKQTPQVKKVLPRRKAVRPFQITPLVYK